MSRRVPAPIQSNVDLMKVRPRRHGYLISHIPPFIFISFYTPMFIAYVPALCNYSLHRALFRCFAQSIWSFANHFNHTLYVL